MLLLTPTIYHDKYNNLILINRIFVFRLSMKHEQQNLLDKKNYVSILNFSVLIFRLTEMLGLFNNQSYSSYIKLTLGNHSKTDNYYPRLW